MWLYSTVLAVYNHKSHTGRSRCIWIDLRYDVCVFYVFLQIAPYPKKMYYCVMFCIIMIVSVHKWITDTVSGCCEMSCSKWCCTSALHPIFRPTSSSGRKPAQVNSLTQIFFNHSRIFFFVLLLRGNCFDSSKRCHFLAMTPTSEADYLLSQSES